MNGRCLCGDPCCPSCGPAQGYCPRCYENGLDHCECHDMDDELYERWRAREIDEAAEKDANKS